MEIFKFWLLESEDELGLAASSPYILLTSFLFWFFVEWDCT